MGKPFMTKECEMFEYAKKIVKVAAHIARDGLCGDVSCAYKNGDHRDLITPYDKKIEEFLIHKISHKYPDHCFVAEERVNSEAMDGYVWIIDPIDGTTNFVCWQREFAVSLALYRRGKPVFGLVYDVINDDLYWGISGRGAGLNDKQLKKLHRVELQDCIIDMSLNTVEAFFADCNIHLFNLAKSIRGHRSCGVASLAICRIAVGEIHVFISAKLRSWDFAAAGIILEEVGGYFHAVGHRELNLTGKPVAFMACLSKELFWRINNEYFSVL
jgi:myo-inositol-1(or 4)-monophosphatase